ncbi:MAG: hypothetical protein BGO67_00995 [Alphaproteobacteria bacterium 41-28]|nr:MAG: hypothetical protein BGO67_00995 [Alphaproteobacteria bacterium 41-28]
MHFGLIDGIKKNKLLGKLLAIVSVLAISSVPVEAARTPHKSSAKSRKKAPRVRKVRVRKTQAKVRKTRVRVRKARVRVRKAVAPKAQRRSLKQTAARKTLILHQQQTAATQEAEYLRIANLAEARDPQVNVATRQALLHSNFEKNYARIRLLSGDIPDPHGPISGTVGYPAGTSGTTDQYRHIGLPKTTVLFPYNLEDLANERGYVSPSFPINIKAKYTRNFAPHALHLNLGDVDDDNIEAFIVAQTLPWLGTSPVQVKPHSWLDPNAPNEAVNYDRHFTVKIGIFSDNDGPLIEGQQRGRLIEENRISTHSAGAAPNPRQVVSSGNVLSIVNLDLNQYNATSHVIFSLTKYRDPATGILKAAAVKHVLLTEDDAKIIEQLLDAPTGRPPATPITLEEFNVNLNTFRGALSRPDIADEFDPYPPNRRP